MSRPKKPHPALKHGGYAASRLLPGEDADAFNKLYGELIDEFTPTGPFEEDIIFTLARLIWRKQHLGTFQMIGDIKHREREIQSEIAHKTGVKPPKWPPDPLSALREKPTFNSKEHEKAWDDTWSRAAAQARKELGEKYKLLELGYAASQEALLKELEVEERLDALIEKCLKRLLLARGVKSIAPSADVAPSTRPPRLLSGVG